MHCVIFILHMHCLISLCPKIDGFAAQDVALGMYERVYYPLTSSTGGDGQMSKTGVVVDIDRTAGTPVVTLRPPLLVSGTNFTLGNACSCRVLFTCTQGAVFSHGPCI